MLAPGPGAVEDAVNKHQRRARRASQRQGLGRTAAHHLQLCAVWQIVPALLQVTAAARAGLVSMDGAGQLNRALCHLTFVLAKLRTSLPWIELSAC